MKTILSNEYQQRHIVAKITTKSKGQQRKICHL